MKRNQDVHLSLLSHKSNKTTFFPMSVKSMQKLFDPDLDGTAGNQATSSFLHDINTKLSTVDINSTWAHASKTV